MALDLVLRRRTSTNWSRGGDPPSTEVVPPVAGKVALAGATLGMLLSLTLATSPRKPFPRPVKTGMHTDYTGVRLPRRQRWPSTW